MIIDISKLNNNLVDIINIEQKVIIDEKLLLNSDIQKIKDVNFNGEITKLIDNTYCLVGRLVGVMVLLDNLTLEEVDYHFDIEIDENIENIENMLDIMPILWQNILVEVPLKVISPTQKDIKLKGKGWRLIKENEEDSKEYNDSPFKELDKLLDKGKE